MTVPVEPRKPEGASALWHYINKRPREMVTGDIYTEEQIKKWTDWLQDRGPEYFL